MGHAHLPFARPAMPFGRVGQGFFPDKKRRGLSQIYTDNYLYYNLFG
jgi:hypothetical protein